jgi:hypothetical protein
VKEKARAAASKRNPACGTGEPAPARSQRPAPITDEAVALRSIEAAKDGDEAAQILDLCIGQPFYRARRGVQRPAGHTIG